MENEKVESNASVIESFCDITSASKREAVFFLESHKFELDAAVSSFFDNNSNLIENPRQPNARSRSPSNSPNYSPSESSSPSPPPPTRAPYALRTRRRPKRKVRTETDSDEDQGQEDYTARHTSGMLVQDRSEANDEECKQVKKPQMASSPAPLPQEGLIVDESSPSTSIQLRLVDGTRMVSRFNRFHTVRDIRAFIDASRSDGSRNYRLQMMGFPPKQLTDLDETIEQAGLANSVVIQKY